MHTNTPNGLALQKGLTFEAVLQVTFSERQLDRLIWHAARLLYTLIKTQYCDEQGIDMAGACEQEH